MEWWWRLLEGLMGGRDGLEGGGVGCDGAERGGLIEMMHPREEEKGFVMAVVGLRKRYSTVVGVVVEEVR
jgi:hypothetical protein